MKHKIFLIAFLSIFLFSCKQHYHITSITGTIVEMNDAFDKNPDPQMQALIDEYKTKLDAEMNVVIGTTAQFLDYGRPESLLTNLTSDVMKAYGDEQLPHGVDLAVMNVNGHRANIPKGKITEGNLYETYSFDNTVTFLELKGAELNKIFDAYARLGGAGISKNVKLVIQNEKVKSVTIDGKPIDENKIYNIATLDYLVGGNDGMAAFKNAQKVINSGITLRDVMIDYVKEQTRRGEEVSSALDGRIIVLK